MPFAGIVPNPIVFDEAAALDGDVILSVECTVGVVVVELVAAGIEATPDFS